MASGSSSRRTTSWRRWRSSRSCASTAASRSGPAPTVEHALHLVRAETLDGAILDINLRDQLIFPVAAELERRGIPFIFATGYEDGSALPADLADRPRLRKPYSERQLVELLTTAIAKT